MFLSKKFMLATHERLKIRIFNIITIFQTKNKSEKKLYLKNNHSRTQNRLTNHI